MTEQLGTCVHVTTAYAGRTHVPSFFLLQKRVFHKTHKNDMPVIQKSGLMSTAKRKKRKTHPLTTKGFIHCNLSCQINRERCTDNRHLLVSYK